MGLGDLSKMMSVMKKMKEDLAREKVTTGAGKGAVLVTVNGNMEVTEIKIDPASAPMNDPQRLSEMIRTAVNEAVSKSQSMAASRMGGVLGAPGLDALKNLAGL